MSSACPDRITGFQPHRRLALAALLAAALAATGCEREERRFRRELPVERHTGISQSDLYPGHGEPPAPAKNPLEGNAHAIAEGRRLYVAFNCVGCHFNGGGGIGPPLMDDRWIYGSQPANLFHTIVEGRPNGMPSFRGRLNDDQVWQIASYLQRYGGRPLRTTATEKPEDPPQQNSKSGG